jgi:hypothetical protein
MVGKEEYCVFKRERGTGERAVNETAVVRNVFFLLYGQPRPACAYTDNPTILKIVKADEKGAKKMDARILAQGSGGPDVAGWANQFRVQEVLSHRSHSRVIMSLKKCIHAVACWNEHRKYRRVN